jgi:uncharacterized damage-inducible protein DinB
MKFDPAVFVDQFEFIEWGDDLLITAAAQLPEAEYLKDRGISAGSMHKLLVHMMAAEWVWLSRWRGEASPQFYTIEDYPTIESLAERWSPVHADIKGFLSEQTSGSLEAPFSYRDTRGQRHTLPLARFVQHMLDHGTYHRGQANTLLKLSGGAPINLSLYRYYELKA